MMLLATLLITFVIVILSLGAIEIVKAAIDWLSTSGRAIATLYIDKLRGE